MDNKSHSSIPQGLRNHSGSFKADPVEKEEAAVKSSAKPQADKSSHREDFRNNFYGDEHRFGGNLTHNGDDPDKVPVVPSLSDDEVPNLPGAILKHAREMLGLSQREIALRLKLRVNTISDIEHDRLTQPTAAPFARGYIADYARLVNIDPKAVVDLYNHNVLEAAEMAKNQSKVAAKKRAAALTAEPKVEMTEEAKEASAESASPSQEIPAINAVNNDEGKSNKGMLVKLGAVLLALLLIIAAVWLFMSDDAKQSGTSGTVTVNESIATEQDNNASSGELIIDDASSETATAEDGYQDLLNAPAEDPFADKASVKENPAEELLISSSPAADKSSPAETSGKTSNDMELVVAPSPSKADDAAKAAKEEALKAKQAAEEKLKQEQAKLKREAEEKLKQEALKKEEEAKAAAAQAPKLSGNLRDISSSAKLRGREGLASLNNVSVRVKAPVSLKITDSRGKVLVSGSYKTGDRVSATGIPPLKVSVTDTSSVTVNYMGGTIAVPAAKQASFTLPNR